MRGLEGRICENKSAFIREAEVGSWTFVRESSAWRMTQPQAAALHPRTFSPLLNLLTFASSPPQPFETPPRCFARPSSTWDSTRDAAVLPSKSRISSRSSWSSDSVTPSVRYLSLAETLTGLSRSEKSGFKPFEVLGVGFQPSSLVCFCCEGAFLWFSNQFPSRKGKASLEESDILPFIPFLRASKGGEHASGCEYGPNSWSLLLEPMLAGFVPSLSTRFIVFNIAWGYIGLT
ncbi:hypothetical protein BJX61DRAFT_404379 [Aspergillus egyptiacus]|nr:hypothetical protein BJX61DRAFT_404379 [Aspergillus egyptiacus]